MEPIPIRSDSQESLLGATVYNQVSRSSAFLCNRFCVTQPTIQADNILGLVSRAGTAEWFTQHIPVYPQAPMFEAFLGRCIIHNLG